MNQIQFEPNIDLKDVKDYLDSRMFDNLKYASITAELETNNHVLPITLDYDLKDINKIISSYTAQKKAIVEGIRKSKLPKPDPKIARREQNTKIANEILQSAADYEKIYKKPRDKNNPAPTPADIEYVKENGFLPAKKMSVSQATAMVKDLQLPQEFVGYTTDPMIIGKHPNATIEDQEAAMTVEEKTQRTEDRADLKIQEDVVSQTDETTLKTLESTEDVESESKAVENNSKISKDKTKTSKKQSPIKVSHLSYFTNVGDTNTTKAAASANKPNQKQGTKSDTSKPKLKSKTPKSKKPKLEDNITKTITQDITNQFKQSPEEAKAIKETQQKSKDAYLKSAKTNKQQHNKMEQAMLSKEGITVDAVEDSAPSASSNPSSKTSFVESLLSLGGLKAEAKGLNNSKYSLILYSARGEIDTGQNLSITFDSTNQGTEGYLRPSAGTYGTQRFCFNNSTNEIRLAYGGQCNETYNRCLDNSGGLYGQIVVIWECHGGVNQKWVFDERGRISIMFRPDLCLDSGTVDNGTKIKLLGCHNGASQMLRAGYNNFGTGMGMTMWAINSGNLVYNLPGHAFVELWNNYGAHNTFSRWDFNDIVCSNNGPSTNNICDYDAITVDVEIDLKTNPNKYSNFRKRGINLTKPVWDYITFGSGHRNNYWYGTNVDLGGSGTYNGNSTQSRNTNYPAFYGISNGSNSGPNNFNLQYVCSGYAIKLWNAYKGNNAQIDPNYFSEYITPWSPATIFAQIN